MKPLKSLHHENHFIWSQNKLKKFQSGGKSIQESQKNKDAKIKFKSIQIS